MEHPRRADGTAPTRPRTPTDHDDEARTKIDSAPTLDDLYRSHQRRLIETVDHVAEPGRLRAVDPRSVHRRSTLVALGLLFSVVAAAVIVGAVMRARDTGTTLEVAGNRDDPPLIVRELPDGERVEASRPPCGVSSGGCPSEGLRLQMSSNGATLVAWTGAAEEGAGVVLAVDDVNSSGTGLLVMWSGGEPGLRHVEVYAGDQLVDRAAVTEPWAVLAAPAHSPLSELEVVGLDRNGDVQGSWRIDAMIPGPAPVDADVVRRGGSGGEAAMAGVGTSMRASVTGAAAAFQLGGVRYCTDLEEMTEPLARQPVYGRGIDGGEIYAVPVYGSAAAHSVRLLDRRGDLLDELVLLDGNGLLLTPDIDPATTLQALDASGRVLRTLPIDLGAVHLTCEQLRRGLGSGTR